MRSKREDDLTKALKVGIRKLKKSGRYLVEVLTTENGSEKHTGTKAKVRAKRRRC